MQYQAQLSENQDTEAPDEDKNISYHNSKETHENECESELSDIMSEVEVDSDSEVSFEINILQLF